MSTQTCSELVLDTIFSFLDIKELGRCAQVCSYWNIESCKDRTWQKFTLGFLPPEGMKVKDFVRSFRIIENLTEVKERFLQAFAQAIPLDLSVSFAYDEKSFIRVCVCTEKRPRKVEYWVYPHQGGPSPWFDHGEERKIRDVTVSCSVPNCHKREISSIFRDISFTILSR